MEESGLLAGSQKASLPDLCKAMGESLAELVRQVSPTITQRDVSELPLLTIGSQFQGGHNVTIGKEAVEAVHLSVREIVKGAMVQEQKNKIIVKNSSGRAVTLLFRSDPDIGIHEELGAGQIHNKVAIEIKGGTDKSNAHNRAGEAEKSHRNAKLKGFSDFWTVIAKKGVNLEKLREESPTTNLWFDVSQVLARDGEDWEEFRQRLAVAVGIPE